MHRIDAVAVDQREKGKKKQKRGEVGCGGLENCST